MANGYMPRKDAEALRWMRTFADGLVAHAAIYSVTPEEAAAVNEAVEVFAAALSRASQPGTRTTVAVKIKDQARRDAELVCRPIYAWIRTNSAIDDEAKIAIGVRPINPQRIRIKAPDSAPLLQLSELSWSYYTIIYRDRAVPSRVAKPFGVTQLQLFRAVGDGPVTDMNQIHFYRACTRSPIRIDYTSADDGKTATYFGRWMTRKGEFGPWSPPLSVRVASMGLRIGSRLAA